MPIITLNLTRITTPTEFTPKFKINNYNFNPSKSHKFKIKKFDEIKFGDIVSTTPYSNFYIICSKHEEMRNLNYLIKNDKYKFSMRKHLRGLNVKYIANKSIEKVDLVPSLDTNMKITEIEGNEGYLMVDPNNPGKYFHTDIHPIKNAFTKDLVNFYKFKYRETRYTCSGWSYDVTKIENLFSNEEVDLEKIRPNETEYFVVDIDNDDKN